MKEIWKTIPGYKGQYQISSLGRCRRIEGHGSDGRVVHERIIHSEKLWDGYLRVTLCSEGKYYHKSVSRLVASAFIPNPENKPQVNHKDQNPANNCMDNLEWVTVEENLHYGDRIDKVIKSLGTKVQQYDTSGRLIAEFDSINQAERAMRGRSTLANRIWRCLKKQNKSAYGYIWKIKK